MIQLPTNRYNTIKEEFEVTEDLIKEFFECYPNVDIYSELRKMRAWLISNDTKRKTKKGMKRFVNSWLSRCQDSPTIRRCKTTREMTLADELLDKSWAHSKNILDQNRSTRDIPIDEQLTDRSWAEKH